MAPGAADLQNARVYRRAVDLIEDESVLRGSRQLRSQPRPIAPIVQRLAGFSLARVAAVARASLGIEQIIRGIVVRREAAAAITAIVNRPRVANVELDRSAACYLARAANPASQAAPFGGSRTYLEANVVH